MADAARIRALERENAELRGVNAILRTASAFSRPSSTTVALVVAFIEACGDELGVEQICGALRLAAWRSRVGYYAARARALSARAVHEQRWRRRF